MSIENTPYLQKLFEVNRNRYEPRGLIVDLIRQCTETCRHCVVAASPKRREKLKLKQVEEAIKDAVRNNFASVSFYGGEPFTAKELLYDSIALAYEHGLLPQVMSNGYWGHSEEMAHRTFDRLAATQPIGTDLPMQINLSTDEFHNKDSQKNIARILTAWIRRNEPMNINIAAGYVDKDDNEESDPIDGILDEFDAMNEGSNVISCLYETPVFNQPVIGFIDKTIKAPRNISIRELVALLRNEEMLQDADLKTIEQKFRTAEDVFRYIEANKLLMIAQSKQNITDGVVRLGRMMPSKTMQFRRYSINLFGAGRLLQGDPSMMRRAANTSHQKTNREPNIHEFESILILGNDNRFYTSPIQLQHQVRPLGENTGNDIAKVIERVNMGEPVSNIIMLQDLNSAKALTLTAGDTASYERILKLEREGLIQEALEIFLMSKMTMESLPVSVERLRPDMRRPSPNGTD